MNKLWRSIIQDREDVVGVVLFTALLIGIGFISGI